MCVLQQHAARTFSQAYNFLICIGISQPMSSGTVFSHHNASAGRFSPADALCSLIYQASALEEQHHEQERQCARQLDEHMDGRAGRILERVSHRVADQHQPCAYRSPSRRRSPSLYTSWRYPRAPPALFRKSATMTPAMVADEADTRRPPACQGSTPTMIGAQDDNHTRQKHLVQRAFGDDIDAFAVVRLLFAPP